MHEARSFRWDSLLGYLVVAGFAFASYALIVGPYLDFANHILPAGDPFSYTVNWFRRIDQARADYLGAIKVVLGTQGGWYRLMNFLLVVLSPLLAKEPASLCAVNFLMWGIGAAAFFHLGCRLGLDLTRSFTVALIPWLWPISYGFADYTSTPVLSLDAAFTGALHIAVAMSIVFALDPRRTLSAVLAAISIGVAIWGRGNSIFVVGLVVFWPCIIAFAKALRQRNARTWINITLVALIAGGMTVEFYVRYWGPLVNYYGLHLNLAEHHSWSLRDSLVYFKNIPGYMMWHHKNSWLTIALSWSSHLIPIVALVAAKSQSRRNIAATGAFIYYATFVTNLVLWNDPFFTLDNALLVWRPMLIGLSLSLIVLFTTLTDRYSLANSTWLIAPIFGAALIWGAAWTSIMTPRQLGTDRPKPSVVERFAVSLESLLDGNDKLSFLWYNNWNAPLLTYYRLKADLGEPPLYYGPGFQDIWSMSSLPGEDQGKRVLVGIKEEFKQAAVIIPEFTDDYGRNEPYALYRFHDIWAAWLNSPDAPKMRVVMILQESSTKRLLVLMRDDIAAGRGDELRLPWGNRPAAPRPDYSAAVIRFR